LKKVIGLPTQKKPGSGSKEPNKVKVGKVTAAQLEQVAKMKMQDMNCFDLQSAINMVAGTAKSMGLELK
jgi:large subunit ribosomal protein L11